MNATEQHELLAWLGPAAGELTPEQTDRLARIADWAADRYPGPDRAEEREAALSAATQYLLGETTTGQVRAELAQARRVEALAKAAAITVAVIVNEDGAYEEDAVQQLGINRRTLRRAKGIDD